MPENDEDLINKFEIIPPTQEDEDEIPIDPKVKDEPVEETPTMGHPKWSAYVLSKFEEDETIEGNPTVDGLRRVATVVLGPIIVSKSAVIGIPTPDNAGHATVEHTIAIMFDDGDIRTFTECADVNMSNTDSEYARYPSATASTRAEGRALRKALQLKRVVSAEEVDSIPLEQAGKITTGQIQFIENMCHRNDINVLKVINLNSNKQYKKIEEVPQATAVLINKFLSECQSGKRQIPEKILGYDSNWRQVNESVL